MKSSDQRHLYIKDMLSSYYHYFVRILRLTDRQQLGRGLLAIARSARWPPAWPGAPPTRPAEGHTRPRGARGLGNGAMVRD